MPEAYFIVYNPMTVNVMDALGKCDTPLDLLGFLTRRDGRDLSESTWLDFLGFAGRAGTLVRLTLRTFNPVDPHLEPFDRRVDVAGGTAGSRRR